MSNETEAPELKAALETHGLKTDKPSQLSDAFRLGWNTRADLSDDLVRAALEAAAEYHDEIYEHDMSGIEYSMLVGIPISNHADLEQSCKRAEIAAKAIRALADDPKAMAAIKAKAGWA